MLVKSEVLSIDESGEQVVAKIKKPNDEFVESYDRVLLAVGVTANIENMGLENIGIKIDSNFLETNEFCQVISNPHIYAIGDVAGGKQLAHKASREGMIAAEHAAGNSPLPLNQNYVPACTYTSPQVASVGLKKAELEEKNISYNVGTFPLSASGRALAAAENRGFVRVYIEKNTGELLGAHMVGHEVTELISNFALAQAGELTIKEFLQSVFPHPTMAESLHEAIAQSIGESTNI